MATAAVQPCLVGMAGTRVDAAEALEERPGTEGSRGLAQLITPSTPRGRLYGTTGAVCMDFRGPRGWTLQSPRTRRTPYG